MATLLKPALRVAGTRRVEGLIVGELDGDHAGGAAELAAQARPRAVFAAEPVWTRRHDTLAGEALDGAMNAGGIPAVVVHAGQAIDLGAGVQVEILWPAAGAGAPLRWRFDRGMHLWQTAGVEILDPRGGKFFTAGDSWKPGFALRGSDFCRTARGRR